MAILGYPSKRFSALALFPSTARVHATRKKKPDAHWSLRRKKRTGVLRCLEISDAYIRDRRSGDNMEKGTKEVKRYLS